MSDANAAAVALRQEIARRMGLLGELGRMLDELTGAPMLLTVAPPLALPAHVEKRRGKHVPAGRAGRRARVAPGSLPDRLLSVLKDAGEPVEMKALMDGGQAPVFAVRTEVGRLIEAGRVVKTGMSRGTRYALVK